jgi:hypothetical protein
MQGAGATSSYERGSTNSLDRELNACQGTKDWNQKRRLLFKAQDQVEACRDGLIADSQARMGQTSTLTSVFTVCWSLKN